MLNECKQIFFYLFGFCYKSKHLSESQHICHGSTDRKNYNENNWYKQALHK